MSADLDRAMLQKNLDTLERLGEAVGEWTSKSDARQTGVSMHLRFAKKVDVYTSLEFVQVMERCPAMLADACRRLLAMTEPDEAAS